MKSLFWALPCLLALRVGAAQGSIETSDGAQYEGDVQWESGGFRVTGTNGAHRVELARLAHFKLLPPPATNTLSATGQVHGLRGAYFNQPDFGGEPVVRIDATVDFNWQEGQPIAAVGPDLFSVRWEGQVRPPQTGKFTFHTQTDDGVRLWVNRQLLIDRWQDQSGTEWSGSIELEADKSYPLRLEYYDKQAGAQARLLWSTPTLPRQVVPATNLFTVAITPTKAPPSAAGTAAATPATAPTNGLTGLYFNEADLTGEFKVRHDAKIDFDWGEEAPLPGLGRDRFSVRWQGKLLAPASEYYTFHVVTDDGVRLWVNNRLLIDAWRQEFLNLVSMPTFLNGGQAYDLQMEMFDGGGRAMAKLYWSTTTMPRAILPEAQLRPVSVPEVAGRAPSKTRLPPGVWMTDGNFVARRVYAGDESSVRFSESRQEPGLSTVKIARIVFQSLAADVVAGLPTGRTGLLLTSKDFVEADFKGVRHGRIQMSSVLFGIKTYEVSRALALLLREPVPVPARYEVVTRDESRFAANTLAVDAKGVRLEDLALAGWQVPAEQIVEIRRRE